MAITTGRQPPLQAPSHNIPRRVKRSHGLVRNTPAPPKALFGLRQLVVHMCDGAEKMHSFNLLSSESAQA